MICCCCKLRRVIRRAIKIVIGICCTTTTTTTNHFYCRRRRRRSSHFSLSFSYSAISFTAAMKQSSHSGISWKFPMTPLINWSYGVIILPHDWQCALPFTKSGERVIVILISPVVPVATPQAI